MHIRPKTIREKIWAVIMVGVLIQGVATTGNLYELAGYTVAVFALYLLPIVVAPFVYKSAGKAKGMLISKAT